MGLWCLRDCRELFDRHWKISGGPLLTNSSDQGLSMLVRSRYRWWSAWRSTQWLLGILRWLHSTQLIYWSYQHKRGCLPLLQRVLIRFMKELLEDLKRYFLFNQGLCWLLKLSCCSFHLAGLDSTIVASLDCLSSYFELTMVRKEWLNP